MARKSKQEIALKYLEKEFYNKNEGYKILRADFMGTEEVINGDDQLVVTQSFLMTLFEMDKNKIVCFADLVYVSDKHEFCELVESSILTVNQVRNIQDLNIKALGILYGQAKN